jgi:hypothetical protein
MEAAMRSSIVSLFLAATCAACASTSTAQHPSAAEHEALASDNERAAKEHLTSAETKSHRAGACGVNGSWDTCWTPNDDVNRVDAEEHMRVAMQHLQAAQALRDAQARACAGVSQIDREVSPFAHVKDITTVEPLNEGKRILGAKVTFRHVENLTPQSLQRTVDCHIAQADALGHKVPEEMFCPLNLPNVKATVTAAASGYDVAITTDDPDSAKEVLRRAQMLKQ